MTFAEMFTGKKHVIAGASSAPAPAAPAADPAAAGAKMGLLFFLFQVLGDPGPRFRRLLVLMTFVLVAVAITVLAISFGLVHLGIQPAAIGHGWAAVVAAACSGALTAITATKAVKAIARWLGKDKGNTATGAGLVPGLRLITPADHTSAA